MAQHNDPTTLVKGAHIVAESVAMMKASGAYVHRL